MGEVWRARDERPNGSLCAVKGIRIGGADPQERADQQTAIEREAKLLSNLHHAAICTILDLVKENGSLFLVLEWIEGRNLAEELGRRGTPGLPLAEVLRWTTILAEALDYLHAQAPPIIFRDLKPANIMLRADGRITLIDFGIARRMVTSGGTRIGTAGYAPLEQYQGIANPRCDIYALAATLHHLLTGRNPERHQAFDFPAVRTLIPSLPPQVEAALVRGLQMNAADRFPTVSDFVSALPGTVPAVNSPAPRRINIRMDGSGDYPTLETAVRRAPASATIALAAGEYRLRQSLQVSRALTLLGAGMDQTRLVCAETGPVVLFEGSGPFTAKGLTFAHVGLKVSDVVMVMKGRVDFQDCRFTGGVHDAANGERGNGLWLREDACGTIRHCTASGNEWNGLRVSDQAQPTLEANICEQNKGTGIAYLGTARGTARNNICRANKQHGISLGEDAQPILEANSCEGNMHNGIAYLGSAGGTARQNICRANKQHGISVGDHAQPILEANSCDQNIASGIAYFDSASGTARQNTCRANQGSGVYVGQHAGPTLETNKYDGNTNGSLNVAPTAHPKLRQQAAPISPIRGTPASKKQPQPTPRCPPQALTVTKPRSPSASSHRGASSPAQPKPVRTVPIPASSGARQTLLMGSDSVLVVKADSTSLWSLWEGTRRWTIPNPYRYAALSPNGDLLALHTRKEIHIWAVRLRAFLKKLPSPSTAVASAFSPDGQFLAAAREQSVQLWSVATGQQYSRLDGHTGHVLSLAFSPSGKSLISSGTDKTVRRWEVATRRESKRSLGNLNTVSCVAYSLDGRIAALAGMDGTVRLWRSLKRAPQVLGGHQGKVLSVAFSPDGSMVASAGADHIIRLWDVADGRQIHKLDGHRSSVHSVAFCATPQGARLISADNHTVVLWDVSTGDQIRRLELDGR